MNAQGAEVSQSKNEPADYRFMRKIKVPNMKRIILFQNDTL